MTLVRMLTIIMKDRGDGKDDDGSCNDDIGEDGSDDDGDVENDEQVKKLSDRRGRLHNAHMKTSSQLDNLKYSASEIGGIM